MIVNIYPSIVRCRVDHGVILLRVELKRFLRDVVHNQNALPVPFLAERVAIVVMVDHVAHVRVFDVGDVVD